MKYHWIIVNFLIDNKDNNNFLKILNNTFLKRITNNKAIKMITKHIVDRGTCCINAFILHPLP